MSSISSLLHKAFPNDPEFIQKSVANGAAKEAAWGAATGGTIEMVLSGGNKQKVKVGAAAGAVWGGNIGAIKGAISGSIRYGIGVALFGKAR